MADLDDIREGREFGRDRPADTIRFFLKGAAHLDWGLKARLARIFRPATGRTVMLAFDHGYFQGPTRGLERIDLTIAPIAAAADVLMCTRGALRSMIAPETGRPVMLRCSAGSSVLTELSNELVAVDIEDAIRLDAAGMAAQVYIGAEFEHRSIANVVKLVDTGTRYGIPTMAVTAVGKEMARDARYFALASRIAAELGAHLVKTYFVEEGFEKVALSCPVPIVIAGGKKLPERAALAMARRAIDEGAAGVDMGRNVFQSEAPAAMLQALNAVVHGGETAEQAYGMFMDLREPRAA
ncbi:MAG: 3-hydroxy-5-phosphonooxypentane-2,4-dione thiolase [Rhodobacteraceae bacterium]|nr:3-hydroxy-5-phosphonooxypentane-2,4-dione thiolase [Paracoccaceae bacterium]